MSVSPSGNEALPFGHSKNQSISGTLTACLPSFLPTLLGTPMCSSCLGFVAPCFVVLESGNWRSAGRSVGRPLSERNGGCCGRGSGIALAMVGAPGLWLPPAAPDRSKRAGRRAEGSVTPLSPFTVCSFWSMVIAQTEVSHGATKSLLSFHSFHMCSWRMA